MNSSPQHRSRTGNARSIPSTTRNESWNPASNNCCGSQINRTSAAANSELIRSPGRFNAQPPMTIVSIRRRADGRGRPARQPRVKPEQRNQHDSPHRPRQAQRPQQREQDPEENRHPQSIHGKNVVGGGANKRFRDLFRQHAPVSERERPFAAAEISSCSGMPRASASFDQSRKRSLRGRAAEPASTRFQSFVV